MNDSNTNKPKALRAGIAIVAAIALGWPAAAAAAPSAEAVRDYWTPSRMRAAEPVEVAPGASRPQPAPLTRGGAGDHRRTEASYVAPAEAGAPARARLSAGERTPPRSRILGAGVDRSEVADPAAPPVRMHGKVFFTIPRGGEAGDYVCSGTAVNSRNRSVVWTAGHCVFEPGEGVGYATNWAFVPGYSGGRGEASPFGEWPARKLATTGGWRRHSSLRRDLGAAVVTRNAAGQRLGDVVGGRGIGFGQPRARRYEAFGYPAISPPLEFDGQREFECTGAPVEVDNRPPLPGPPPSGIRCDMTAGASGGGWIADGTLLSVTSYGYPAEPSRADTLYGPYMAGAAKRLYKEVRGKRNRGGAKRGGKRGGKR